MTRHALAPVLVILAAVLAMEPARSGSFVYDDEYYVVRNPAVSADASPWATPLGDPGQALWRPVTVTTWRWQWPRGALVADPAPFRLANIALHAAASVLLLILARRLGLAPVAATLAALLFAVHPVHSEAVAWITGRAELLAAVLLLAAWIAHLGKGPGSAGLAALCVALAALSKESALAAPAVFVLVDLARGRRPRPLARWALLATAVGAVAAARLLVLPAWFPEDAPYGSLPSPERAVVAMNLAGRSLSLLIWPHPLRIHYHRDEFTRVDPIAVAALALAAVIAIALGRRDRLAAAGLLSVPVALLPVLNLIPIGETFAERFLYFPSIPACLAAGSLFGSWARRQVAGGRGAGASLVLPAAVLVAGIATSRAAAANFEDDLSLWSHAASVAPENAHVRYNHGYYLDLAGRHVTEARDRPGSTDELAASLRLEPQHVYAAFAHQMLGNRALGAVGAETPDISLAAGHFRAALELRPQLADATINLAGIALLEPGLVDPGEAAARLDGLLVRTDLSAEQRAAAQAVRSQIEASSSAPPAPSEPTPATGTSSPEGS